MSAQRPSQLVKFKGPIKNPTFSVPATELHWLQALHHQHYCYPRKTAHIAGTTNVMADDCSQLWYLSDKQHLTHCKMLHHKNTQEYLTNYTQETIKHATHKNSFTPWKDTLHRYAKLCTNKTRANQLALTQKCLHLTYWAFNCVVMVEITTFVVEYVFTDLPNSVSFVRAIY